MSDFDIGTIQNNTFVGILENTDLSDTYHFNNLTASSFSFSFTGLNGGSLQLLNNAGNILQTTNSETININSLLPGNYSLKIVANNPSNYSLKITSANSILPEIDSLTGLPFTTPTPPSHNLFESGIFRVNSTGKITLDYLYDGGRFEGEVGIFNLEGMSAFSAGTNLYIQEAARRAISNSFLGYTVISDVTEGARFSGIFTPNDVNYNSGTHQGIKSFNLLPGSQFGLIIAPRDNLQTIFNNPGLIGGRRPLFSMGTANPNDTFYTGQLTSISNNNTAFAIEDTAVTGNTGHDYDDIILQLQGATNNAIPLSNIINSGTDWRNSTLGQQIVNFVNSADTTVPQITASLANDTGFNNTDKITLDPTITGSIMDPSKIYSFRTRFNNTTPGTYIDAIDLIKADGSFTFNRELLETIYGDSLPDGTHSLYLQAIDENGLISNTLNLSFTLDTKAPKISLKAPFASVNHSPTARIIGSATDIGAGLNNNIQYNLDSQQAGQISLSEIGMFDSKISPTNLTNGTHNLTLQVSDKAGNITQTNVNFNVTNNFNIGLAENQGWGVNSEEFILLNEKSSLYTETTIPIELGQTQGTRKIQFQLSPNFDTTATTTLEDTFQVFLLDPTNANQILLGNSKNQALFSLTGNKPEYTAGLVNYNGSIVEIDLSSLSEKTSGLLLFKLLNNDTDTGTSIEIKNLINSVDIEGISSPIFPERIEQVTAGPTLDISNFSLSQNVEIILNEINLDTTTGLYKANLSVKNNTSSSISRNIAITFPNIPVGIQLQNPSGISNNGIPYINLKNAIQAGGLAAGAISDSVEVVFTNPNLQLFPITANVLIGSANIAPDFPTIAPLTVTPGNHLEIPLTATDANGDTITFSLQSDSVIPTGKISNNKLIFTPTPEEIGTYSFILIASDGDKQTQQTVTLNVITDPITTTRISGVVLSTNGTPLAGVPVELSRLSTLTAADGSFTLELPSSLVPTEPFNIEIPQGDQYFDPYNTGTQYINFRRARYDTSTGTSTNNPRRHPNLVSGFFDGNIVYGSDEQRAMALRTLDGTGKLKTSPGNLLPFNNTNYFPTGPIENDNSGTTDPTKLFVAGDVRASENVALASIHTIFLREHNRLAEQIKQTHPQFTDEQIYQQARRIVIAEIQHITYSEYLPLLLGQNAVTPYTGYDPNIDPMGTPFFATAAFRLGHSQMVSQLLRLDTNNNPISAGNLSLREGFFTTTPIINDGIEPLLRGLVAQQAQDVDIKVIDELRNFLFGPPGSGGMDLPAMNIQRSRDLGLPSYTQARLDFGLSPITDFNQITSNVEVQNALATVYGTVDKIDPWVGGLAEDHVPGAMVGPLFQAVMRNEFLRLRDSDRFWYENGQFNELELASIRSTKLSDLIERNTAITNLPDNIFTTNPIANNSIYGGTTATNTPTEVRSIDGSGNNQTHPLYGKTGQNLRIDYTLDYADNISSPNGEDRPNVREISNGIFAQNSNIPNSVGATGMAIFWGQIISHDISLTPTGTTNTLKIHADNAATNEKYPFVAEPLPLLLGHNVYEGVNNVINRPIYLPAIDVNNGKTINPSEDIIVTTNAIEGASVRVAASTLKDRQGNLFTGQLSITEVPATLTPAALPENIHPDLVVTIQPAEMVFTTPAPLTLPNRAGYAPLSIMDLWSINPITGFFDKVGEGKVSADGSIIETISGGIRNSSWHFFAPPPPPLLEDPSTNPRNPDNACNECKATGDFTSKVELDSGSVIETHQLVSYQSKNVSRGLTLNYDSLRADARQILHFGYSRIQSGLNQRLVAGLKVKRGEFEYQLPGIAAGQWGLNGGEHVWSIPQSGSTIDAALQIDMRSLPTGLYDYALNSGIYQFTGTIFAGSSSTNNGKILNVNSINSAFGSGWGLAGLQELVENPDGSVLLVDGDGSEMLFKVNSSSYMAPPGDFSVLERINGKFRRTMKDKTIYNFNNQNKLESVSDRNGNLTSYVYDTAGRLNKIIDPVGLETLFTYTGNKITAITDPANRTTLLEYDNAGNLKKITDPDNTARAWEYDTNRHIIAEVDKRNNREQTLYDFAGRAKTAIRKDGSKIDVAPVAVQGLYRPELTTDPFNAPVAFSLPQEVETVSADSNGNVVSQKLDRAGQVISAKDGSGKLPSVKRNELNLVTERTNGRQQTTNYEYDSLTGNLLSVKDSLSGEASPQLPPTDNPEFFVSGNDYFIQPGLVSLAVGDIDEDSKLDIITASPFSNSVTIVSGNGDGTFINTLPPIAVGSSPVSVAIADFNSDQHLDIVTANRYSDNVSVLLGNGDGTFVSSEIAVGIQPVAVVVNDLNNDGLQDIITANRISLDTSSVSVLLGSSDGTFSPKQDYSTAIPAISSLAIKDVNKDGRLDVVAVGIGRAYNFEQDYYSVFLGEESGIFNVTTDYEVAFGSDFVALSDLDDDGNLDMVTANYTADTVSVRRGSGDGTFEAVTDDYQVGNTPVSLALDDVDGDDNTDIVVGVRDGSNVAVLLGDENGSFVRSNDVSVGYAPVSVALADVDLDGDKDLVAGSYGSNVSVRLNTSNDSADTGGTGERRYTYESAFNQVTSESDELGRKTLYEIDPITGNRLSETRVVGNVGGVDDVVTRYSYTNGGLVDTVTDPLGRVTDYDYDLVTGNLTKITYAVGTADEAFQRFEYDTAGNQTAMIDENGNRTEYKYDALNRLYKSTFAVGTVDEGVQQVEYDAEGNQKAVIDENGNRTDNVYDAMGRLVKTVEADPDGTGVQMAPVSVYEYDFNGNQVKVIDPLGRITQSVYDSRNRRIGVIDSDGNRSQFRYDLDNNLTSVIDPLNHRSNFVYDARGRLKNEIDPLGKITTYEYNPANNLIAYIDRNNHRTEYDYDDLGRQTKQINPKQDVFKTTYDKAGNILSEIDELNRTTNYAYDNRNRQTNITDALNGVTKIGYDAVGNRTSVSDPLNRTTTFNYDKRNRLSSVSDPLNHTTTYSYDDVGNVTALSDALQRNTQYVYDKLNRHISTKDALLNTTSVIYDAVGNVISTTDQLGRTTSYTYDNQNHPTTVINPLGDKITTQYDANGNQIAIIDALGNTTTYGYDPLNRPITLTDALNKTTTITYDNSGNLRTITDPEQNTTTYTYDELDRLIEEKNQLNKARYFTYDAVGNRLTAKDRNGRIRQFEYDNLNRQTIEQWLDENSNPINTINYDFDAASQLKYAYDSNSTYGYTYDNAGRLIAVDNWRSSSVPNVRLDYVYDNGNNLLSVTDTIDGIIKGTKSFTVDSLNRVTKITQSGNNVTSLRVDIGYDAASQMKSVTRYSDLLATQLVAQSDYNYDLVGRLTQLTHRKGTATFANYNWSFDAANRIVGFSSPDGNSSYSYDSGNQLTATDHNYQDDEAYSYDDNGNRLGVPYQVQTNNQLQSDGVYNYEYDAEGNRIKQIEIATLKVTEYVWDYRNRLTGVITKDSNGNVVKSVEYTYDVFNRRIAKEIDLDGNGPVVPLVEGLVYDGEHILLSFDGEGNQTHRYLHGPFIDAILADSRGDNQVNWALGDNQGTVRDVINSQGVLENHISYDSFGNVTGETNPSLGFRFGYTGRELDSETGLYFYRARYYDGLNGRFISEDPIGFDGGDGNLYRYVGNSPVNYVDPSGQQLRSDPGVYTNLSPDVPRSDSYHEAQRQWALQIIKNHAAYICEAAKHYNITPDAIAGAILWEALENPYNRGFDGRGQGPFIFTRPGGWNDFGIPGKIHTNRGSEAEAVDSIVKARRPDAFQQRPPAELTNYSYPGIAAEFLRRERLLKDPTVAIEYIAAIMDRAATLYDQEVKRYIPNFTIRNQAGILGIFYQGGIGEKRLEFLRERLRVEQEKFRPQFSKQEKMGPWISQFRGWIRDYLRKCGCEDENPLVVPIPSNYNPDMWDRS